MSEESATVVKIEYLRSIFYDAGMLIALGLKEQPCANLSWDERQYLFLCERLFPFTKEEQEYIWATAKVAKGFFHRYSFSGIYVRVDSFYARLTKNEDFDDTNNISIIFGFYADPTNVGYLPQEVRISGSLSPYPILARLIFAPRPFFWNTQILCANLPAPLLKTPNNSPLQLEFCPKGEYPHIKPLGVTFCV